MLFELIKGIGILYFWTWFIWPFLFVFSLVYSIKNLIRDERPTMNIIISSISLLVIICGIKFMLL